MQIIKINNDYFEVENISTQLTIGSHATIKLTIDTKKNTGYYQYFTDIFDRYNDEIWNQNPNNTIFGIQAKNIKGYGCIIKSIDIDNIHNIMNLSINCNYLEEITIQEKRDELINEVLDQTSLNENNIKKNPK